ncbi:MAG TPA: DUF2188 domain-containing protein [Solirubrobacterales bacterium]|nr:DUF2188 domain-containing protein [Solirubrobacterales bacterium]
METRTANRHVQPNERLGGWEIVRAGSRRASDFEVTKAGAVKKAKEMVRLEGGGEVRVKNDLGKVVESAKVRGAAWSRRAAA